jgi:hypothetical protein
VEQATPQQLCSAPLAIDEHRELHARIEGVALDEKVLSESKPSVTASEPAVTAVPKEEPRQGILLLSSTVLAHLALFLTGIHDLTSFGYTCKYLSQAVLNSKTLNRIAVNNFAVLLSPFGLDPKEFATVLTSAHALTAGSFPLQCITGEDFLSSDIKNNSRYCDKSDIDVYVPWNTRATLRQYFVSQGYVATAAFTSAYAFVTGDAPGEAGYAQIFGDTCRVDECVTFIHSSSGNKIQMLVMTKETDPLAAVVNFDYSFVMTIFDGQKFEVWNPRDVIAKQGTYNEERLLMIKGLWFGSHKGKTTFCSGQAPIDRMRARLCKYEQRGYSVVGPRPPDKWTAKFPPWRWGPEGEQHFAASDLADAAEPDFGIESKSRLGWGNYSYE